MPRLEYKYLLKERDAVALRQAIEPFLEPDPHARRRGGTGYWVHSIYWDNEKLDGVSEKRAGVRLRKKFRVRMYSPALYNDHAFIEIKNKDGQAVSKQRACVHPNALPDALGFHAMPEASLKAVPSSSALDAYRYHVRRLDLAPRVLIKYHREAYVYRFHPGLRITWDRQIQCAPAEGRLHPVEYQTLYPVLEGFVVLEVKTEIGLPSWIWRNCAQVEACQQAVSKYVAGVETLGRLGWRPSPARPLALPAEPVRHIHNHAYEEYA